MKILIPILIMLIASCTSGVSQQPSEEAKKEKEFQDILRMAKEQQVKNHQILKAADEKTKETITQTSQQITTLKQEVKELKQDLNEANNKISNIVNTGNGSKFSLRPIPGGKENR